jgi:TRAP-type mannitol/chloroaromatic compound transport system permease small subunit
VPDDSKGGGGLTPAVRHLLSFEGVLSLLNSIGTLWIFVLMVVISVDVIGRTAFNSPLPGVLELVRLSIVGIVFIQLGHTLRAGRITRADHLITKLQQRWPRFGFGLQGLFDLAGFGIFVVLLQASLPLFQRSWASGEYAGIEGYVTYPIWPVRLIILIGCVCAGLQFLLLAYRDLRVTVTGQTALTENVEVAESLAYDSDGDR